MAGNSNAFDVSSYAATADKQVALLPGLNTPYKAAASFESNEVSRLVLIKGKDGFKPGGTACVMLQYVHLGIGEFGFTAAGQWFNFVIADLEPKLVTVHGRDLLRIFDYIGLRRMPWIRQADRDFQPAAGAAEPEAIITRIDIDEWKPKVLPVAEGENVFELHPA